MTPARPAPQAAPPAPEEERIFGLEDGRRLPPWLPLAGVLLGLLVFLGVALPQILRGGAADATAEPALETARDFLAGRPLVFDYEVRTLQGSLEPPLAAGRGFVAPDGWLYLEDQPAPGRLRLLDSALRRRWEQPLPRDLPVRTAIPGDALHPFTRRPELLGDPAGVVAEVPLDPALWLAAATPEAPPTPTADALLVPVRLDPARAREHLQAGWRRLPLPVLDALDALAGHGVLRLDRGQRPRGGLLLLVSQPDGQPRQVAFELVDVGGTWTIPTR